MDKIKTRGAIKIGALGLTLLGDVHDNWYICCRPMEDTHCAEGSWEQWVRLARTILEENELRSSETWTGQLQHDRP